MATPKQTDPQFKLRLTPELKDAIERAASDNNRSMNAEIVSRLLITLEKEDPYKKVEEFIDEMNERLREYRETIDEQIEIRKQLEKKNDELYNYVKVLNDITNSDTMKELIEYIKTKEGIR